MACANGHETVVKLLLDRGPDVNKAVDVSKFCWLLVKSECKCPNCASSREEGGVRSMFDDVELKVKSQLGD